MKRTLRLFPVLLALCLTLTACGSAESSEESSGRIITDSCGRTVTVPDWVERIVPLGNAPRLVAYLGLADKVAAVPQCEHTDNPLMAYAYVNKTLWQDLPNVGNDSLGAGEWYAEEILASGADVVICTYDADTADETASPAKEWFSRVLKKSKWLCSNTWSITSPRLNAVWKSWAMTAFP